MKRVACLMLALAALLLPLPLAGAASADASGSLTASLAHATDARLSGPLVAFLQEGSGAGSFTLQAGRLRVETDRAEPAVHTPVLNHHVNESPSNESFDQATVASLAFHDDYRWNLFSADPARPATVEVQAECAEAVGSPDTVLARPAWAGTVGRPATVRDAGGALAWACLGGGSATVRGDLVLSLWSVDALLHDEKGQTREVKTGPQNVGASVPGLPVPGASAAAADVEAYLFATDATLTVPVLADDLTTLLTGPARLEAADLLLAGASGELAVQGRTDRVADEWLRIQGAPVATLRATSPGEPMGAALGGKASHVSLGGRTLAVTGPGAAAVPVGWLLAAGAFALVAAAAAGVARHAWLARAYRRFADARSGSVLTAPRTARERRGAGFWALSYREMVAGRIERAFALSNRSRRLFPRSLDALLLRAALFQRDGGLALALPIYQDAYALVPSRGDRAELACHIATVLVALHWQERSRGAPAGTRRLDEAVSWLQRAANAEVLTFEQAIRDPCFDVLLDHPWFDGARDGSVRQEIARRAGAALPV